MNSDQPPSNVFWFCFVACFFFLFLILIFFLLALSVYEEIIKVEMAGLAKMLQKDLIL